ncbi:hypothetical protein D0Z70_06600 [Sphingobium terrigena]|uniref:Beta-galactosidase n=2 Tax=Sphingobium terrigena TaxID=2304063 RepID=A0A418YVN9_9SPHN|nr:hypothetical protein D0Z70_06600 [Sphingobium terrigena]
MLSAALPCSVATPFFAQAQPVTSLAAKHVRLGVVLTSGWGFQLSDAAAPPASDTPWQSVEVPHSWNRIGSYLPDSPAAATLNRPIDQTQGIGWYKLVRHGVGLHQGSGQDG